MKTKKIMLWGMAIVVPVALIAWIMSLPKIPEDEILSRTGVHWHAELAIKINGEEVRIPANVGIPIGVTHPSNMHTHAEDNTVHIEVEGLVKKDDVRLKNFFEKWGEDFSSTSIMGRTASGSNAITMLVNGIPNTEYENYMIQDHDKIEIVYGSDAPGEDSTAAVSPKM